MKLKKDNETKDIPIICITGELDTSKEINALELGAIDYIRKPYNSIVVKLRVEAQIKLLEKNEEIRVLTTTDKLTGLPNRHCFDERVEVEWHRTDRNKENLSMLMIDIDYFKDYNDTYGHLQGDKALKYTGKIIKNSLTRKVDYVARWGGEEFIVLLSQASYNGTLEIAERIRRNVERAFVLTKSGDKTKLTVSIGAFLCKSPKDDLTIDKFITNADNALYQAKRTGKNKVVMI
jgi:diguanylate cyclase (GGDEF)-like protein